LFGWFLLLPEMAFDEVIASADPWQDSESIAEMKAPMMQIPLSSVLV
jgi:hypothetical protein